MVEEKTPPPNLSLSNHPSFSSLSYVPSLILFFSPKFHLFPLFPTDIFQRISFKFALFLFILSFPYSISLYQITFLGFDSKYLLLEFTTNFQLIFEEGGVREWE
jgi:hypothetical protein